jgi:hypothetical protein
MKIRFSDWLLLATWAFFLAFAGPFLVSARDWLLVSVGGIFIGALVYWTYRAFTHHTEKKTDA